MIYIILTVTAIYLILIGLFVFGFDKVKPFYLNDSKPKLAFSVIIPFRNEAENLPLLLKSISSLAYPKTLFEIILVDDDSEDNSIEIIKKFQHKTKIKIRVIKNQRISNSPKKDAITTAIKIAKNEWILITDADCVIPKYWIDSFDAFIQEQACELIVAPVKFLSSNTFLSRFQILDMLSLQGATIAGFGLKRPFLSNGANLAYKKSLFFEVEGFEGNNQIASGDDVFLLEKVLTFKPEQVKYLKCDKAIVSSFTEATWKSLFAQRIRWASKTKHYNNLFGKLTGLIVFAMNAIILGTMLLCASGEVTFKILFYVLIIKFNIDFYLLFKSASFFEQKELLKSYFLSFIVYPFISTYIAIISLFGGYKWKGRTFKR